MNRRFAILAIIGAPAAFLLQVKQAQAADIPAAKSGQGLIVFYRPRRAKGAAIRFEINNNGRQLGNLSNGGIIFQAVAPGQHSFAVSSPSVGGQDLITLSVAAGQTVFVQSEIRFGWPAGRAKFNSVSETQGRAEVSKM